MNYFFFFLKAGVIASLFYLVILATILTVDLSQGSLFDWVVIILCSPFVSGGLFAGVTTFHLFVLSLLQGAIYFVLGGLVASIYRILKNRK